MSSGQPEPTPWVTHPWVTSGQGRIRFGVAYGPQLDRSPDWGALIDYVQTAAALGFDSFWTADHPLAWSDCWTTLMALAVKTTAIRLGTLVSCVYYRSPALLARLATDVDQASGGRVIFGIGNGDNRSEFERLGMEFPPVRERQAALEEAIQIIRGLWGGGPVTLEGQHFRVREATLGSGPIQQPHVPVLIAGSGERHTLRQVAQYADMSNFGAHAAVGSVFTTAEVQHKIKVLSDHCIALGRPPDSVVRSHWGCPVVVGSMPEEVQRKVAALPAWIRDRFQSSMIAGIPEEVAATYQTLMTAGLNYFTICVMSGDAETLRLLAEQVMPSLAARQTWRAPGPEAR